jgi:hypothetical protein
MGAIKQEMGRVKHGWTFIPKLLFSHGMAKGNTNLGLSTHKNRDNSLGSGWYSNGYHWLPQISGRRLLLERSAASNHLRTAKSEDSFIQLRDFANSILVTQRAASNRSGGRVPRVPLKPLVQNQLSFFTSHLGVILCINLT